MFLKYFYSISLLLAVVVASASQISLDLRPAKGQFLSKKALATGGSGNDACEVGVIRQSALTAGSAMVNGLAVGDVLKIRMYDDVVLELTLAEREESPLTGPTFQAKEMRSNWRDAVVMETADGLLVNATDPESGLVYSVVSSAGGVIVKEIDPKAELACDAPSLASEIVENEELPSKALSSATVADQASTVVDMLVAYDIPAAAWAGQNAGGITNLAQQCVSRMNTALANNGLNTSFRFRLVGVIAVNANANGNLDASLPNIRDGSGVWAPVNAMRESVGADVVSTMIDTGSAYGTTGLGYSLSSTAVSSIRSFASQAYNVLSVRAAAQSHVMTHETGHNMGAGHVGATGQSCNYARGYYFTGTDNKAYHTIMAYNVDENDNVYDQAPLFSDPNHSWAGVVAGDSTHNNARVLANTFLEVSKFRAQKIALSYDVFFSPDSGSLFSDSIQVTLAPGKAGLTIRYTTDGSNPTLSSPIYTGPLTLTNTTTVKAVAVNEGVLGPIYEATYYISNLGYALNAPQLTWSTSPDYPWTAQSAFTYDGQLAVKSADPFPVEGHYYLGENTWLETTVNGPATMSFRYSQCCYTPGFEVSVDGSVVFDSDEDNWGEWALGTIDIPSGSHKVRFSWTLYDDFWTGFNGVALDMVEVITPGIQRNDGAGNIVTIPESWFVENGLVSSGASAAQLSTAADSDADGDGMINWTEYVSGTDPNDSSDYLFCTSISIVDGVPVVNYCPKSGFLSGYRAVVKGKVALTDAQWTATLATHKFFKVFLEKEAE